MQARPYYRYDELPFSMRDVLQLLGISCPLDGRWSFDINCPHCGDAGKHMNISLKKNVFRCNICGFHGGILALYAYYSKVSTTQAFTEIMDRLRLGIPEQRKPFQPIKDAHESALLDTGVRDDVYTKLLHSLTLASDHLKALTLRGLPEDFVTTRLYKTTPLIGHTHIAGSLESAGCVLRGIPGFYRTEDDNTWTLLSKRRGILIPVRDIQGRIQGLQIRLDNASKRKYRWLSTTEMNGGCKAQGWPHVVGAMRETVLLTEGPLKADVIHYFTGQTVLAIPGVNAIQYLEPMLVEMRNMGTRHIMTCFDMDMLTNPHVQAAYKVITAMIAGLGFTYGTYTWDPKYKGLDDFLLRQIESREPVCM